MDNVLIAKQDKEYKELIRKTIEEYNTNGKKTIVYFVDCYYPIIDGVIKVVENYARELSKSFNVVLVVPKHKGKSARDNEFLIIGGASKYFGFVNYDLALPMLDSSLHRFLKELKIDIIHAHSPFTMGKYASKIARKRGIPFVMTMHSQYRQDFQRYVKWKPLLRFMMNKIMRVFNRSTEVWTMHNLAEKTIKDYGYNGRVYLMPNATDYVPPQDVLPLKNKINEKYSIEPTLPVFLFVGRIINQKNVAFLADALSYLDKKGLDFKAFYVGNGPDEDSLKEKIKSLNLESKVILTGRIDDKEELTAYYARSDLFLFPSVYDTSSIVQIEAAALNTPVVFLKDTVTSATVTAGVNGYISERTVEAFAETVYSAISNEKELTEISNNAKRDLYITWEALGKKIAERYDYLIEENANK